MLERIKLNSPEKMATKEMEEPESGWSSLPTVTLNMLFTQLDDNDRYSMSLVCRTWSHAFKNPMLWRERHFHFGGFRGNRNEADRATGFSKAQGKHLKSLYLICDRPSYYLCKRFQKTMTTFFKALIKERTQLREMFFPQLQTERFWNNDNFIDRLISQFAAFLYSQDKLQVFDMSEAVLTVDSAVQILDALTTRSAKTLRIVNLEDYFQTGYLAFRNNGYRLLMSRFTTLRSLYLNYNYLSEDILVALAKNCADTLTYLSVKVYRTDPGFHHIDSYTWSEVTRECPRLNVSIYFEGIGESDAITGCLPREMPLSVLYVWTGARSMQDDWELADTLRYIGNSFAISLKEASLAIETGDEAIDESLLYMIQRCKHLEALDLQAQVLVPTIATICQLQDEKKINLQKCHISAEKLTGIEVQELVAVKQRYDPILEERGLNFRILVGM